MEQNPQTIEFTSENEGSAWSTLAFAWRRKWLIFLALIVGLGLGYLYFLRQAPLYQSSTEIVVIEDQPRLPIEGLEMRASTEEMHVTLMRSQKVIEKAVEVGELDQLATLRGSGNPASAIMSRLTIDGGGTAKGAVLRLSYQSPHADECPQVLQAVVTAYEQFLDEMYEDVSKETIELIKQAKDQLEIQISTIEADLRKMLDDSPLLVTGESALNIHEMRLQEIEQVRSAAVVENSKLQAKIDSLQDALKRGISREAVNLVIGNIEEAAAQASLQEAKSDPLFPLLMEREMLLENHGLDHPKLKAVDKRIEFMREHIKLNRPAPTEVAEPAKNVDYHQTYLESLSEQIKMNEQTIAEMTALFDVERTAAKGLSTYQIREETFRSEIARKSRLFDVVLKRLEEISLVQDRGGAKIQMIHPPARAAQIQPNLQSIMMQASVLSLLVGLGLAFLVDAADRRFRSPDEIRNDLGIPVIGHIPMIPGIEKTKKGKKGKRTVEGDTLPAELSTVHSPRGRIAEAYRAVRTAIYFSTRGGGHQVIQVT
ncbi:MAG TPA: Wzz/FepE/Etk N-terminal domain-containing protein, partial [Pirellulaceae bacterium]|nr:Wzz/FepE/Etk N-terminal domain-containing protein [Pirellulaceae bacterium]